MGGLGGNRLSTVLVTPPACVVAGFSGTSHTRAPGAPVTQVATRAEMAADIDINLCGYVLQCQDVLYKSGDRKIGS